MEFVEKRQLQPEIDFFLVEYFLVSIKLIYSVSYIDSNNV